MCQNYSKDRSGNVSTVNAPYVNPSSSRILVTGEKLVDIFFQNIENPFFVQRLTKRGVLLFDPVENQGQNILNAIKEVTPLPVTTIIYSHNHADHICSTPDILKGTEGNVKIYASDRTAEKMKLLSCKLPPPTDTVVWPKGSFKLEDVTVQLSGFERAAHCDVSAAWLLVEEKVLHHPDLINGNQPPFWRFATAENYIYYRGNVEQLGALDWDHVTLGHGNIGSKEDIKYFLQYLDDLEAAVKDAMATVQFGVVEDLSKYKDHASLMMTWQNARKEKAVDTMRPKYGKTYAFEVSVPTNAEMVQLSMVSYC